MFSCEQIHDFILQTVPHGILCFLPSYKMLEKLSNRWKVTHILPLNQTSYLKIIDLIHSVDFR